MNSESDNSPHMDYIKAVLFFFLTFLLEHGVNGDIEKMHFL
jgi:hypothetical protein